MNKQQITAMQQRIHDKFDKNLIVDGFWGQRSIVACQSYLRSLMPSPNPWPRSDQGSLNKFYGKAGDESNLVSITFPFPMYYDGKLVKTTRVNKRCSASLLRVLTAISDKYHGNKEVIEEAEDYGGCFNFRLKRGGSSYSLHAFGAAIDLDADDNTFKDSWPMIADMPLEIMEEFAKEGWLSAGAFWGYDGMHFQATS